MRPWLWRGRARCALAKRSADQNCRALSFRGYSVSPRNLISPSAIAAFCEALRRLQSLGSRGRGRSQYLVPAYDVAIVDNTASAAAPLGAISLPLLATVARRRGQRVGLPGSDRRLKSYRPLPK